MNATMILPESIDIKFEKAVNTIKTGIEHNIPIKFTQFFNNKKYDVVSINFDKMKMVATNEDGDELTKNISSYDLYEMEKVVRKSKEFKKI